MPWNHRVVLETQKHYDGSEETLWTISEVFYNEDGFLFAYSPKIYGDSKENLKTELERMQKALDKLVLSEVDFNPELQKEMQMQDFSRTQGKPVVHFTGEVVANFLDRSTIYGVLNHNELGVQPWVSTSKTLGIKADAEGEVYEVETLNTIYRKVKNV